MKSNKSIPSCCACGKVGHKAGIGPYPWRAYICPLVEPRGAWGETGHRTIDGKCSSCGGVGFSYLNGSQYSKDGIRGYRCMECGTIKPERDK